MVKLREAQVEYNISDATKIVCDELAQYKANYSTGNKPFLNIGPDNFSLEMLKPLTIGQKFTTAEIQEKLKKAFLANSLKDVPFEFALALLDMRGTMGNTERESYGFEKMFADTVNNKRIIEPLISPSGSAAENIVSDEYLIVVVPNLKSIVIKSLRWNIAAAVLFSIIIIAAFYLTARTMLRQKKLGDIKNDFINNMTHEFKTPISTISLAVDAMRNEKVIQNKEKLNYFSSIIKEENQRMNRQVETILKASQLEKQEVDLMLKPVHAHEVIKEVADNFTLQLEEKNGKAELMLNADNDWIDADEVHFPNLINNLIDNAVKYSKENVPPFVKITTQSNDKELMIRIEDNGIGMSKETLKKIFEKFYRAHTGNIHNVKGFGLGLSYVKTMVEAHGGEIKADSTLGKGSIFSLQIPLKKVVAAV